MRERSAEQEAQLNVELLGAAIYTTAMQTADNEKDSASLLSELARTIKRQLCSGSRAGDADMDCGDDANNERELDDGELGVSDDEDEGASAYDHAAEQAPVADENDAALDRTIADDLAAQAEEEQDRSLGPNQFRLPAPSSQHEASVLPAGEPPPQ